MMLPTWETPTTIDNLLERIDAAYAYAGWAVDRTVQRYGQAWFNALPSDVSDCICGTDVDPFYRDENIPDAEERILEIFIRK